MNSILKHNNENGFALILSLSMLAILSILGAFALMTSSTEVQISGNYSASQQALSAADRAVEYSTNFIRTTNNVANLSENLNLGAHPERLQDDRSGLNTSYDNRVYSVNCGMPPARSGTEIGGDARYQYFAIQVSGRAQTPIVTRVDSYVGRLVAQCN